MGYERCIQTVSDDRRWFDFGKAFDWGRVFSEEILYLVEWLY